MFSTGLSFFLAIVFFFFNDTATTEIYTLSLHDALPIFLKSRIEGLDVVGADLAEVGTVLSVGDGIARIHGLENCEAFEMIELPHDVAGLAPNPQADHLRPVLFRHWGGISQGGTGKRPGR